MNARRREGSLRSGPTLRSDDPALSGITQAEKRRYMQAHARAHGSFSGLKDFAQKFDSTVASAHATQGDLAKELANSLAKYTASIRAAMARGAVSETDAIYLGVCAGFQYANLKHEIERSSKPAQGGTITKPNFLAARRKLGPKASKTDVARELGVGYHGLQKWLKKNLPGEVWA